MRRSLFVLIFFLASFARAQWDLNDLSLLMPLPMKGEESQMWSPRTAGGQGVLLPTRVFSALPQITSDLDQQTLYASALKVVSIRLDPCFREGPTPMPCQRQIRLVWQPLVFEEGSWLTLDAALHTFYVLTDPEWRELTAALRPTGPVSPTAGLPLQIHPILRREGYRGNFWRTVSPILLKFVGEARLSRATAMTVNPLGTVWFFTGLNVGQGGQLGPIAIARIGEKTQGFATNVERDDSKEFRAAMSPSPAEEPTVKKLLNNSRTARANMTEAELQEALRAALRLQNPRFHNPGTADCVSCHVAPTISQWAMNNFPQWNWGQLFPNELYRGIGNATNTTVRPGRAKVLRAFGYFERDPIISNRTINETSEAVRMMLQERAFLGRR